MIGSLVQVAVDYNYNYTPASPAETAGIAGFLFFMWAICMAVVVLAIVGLWKVFVKAGKPGWASLIPVYNMWVLAEIGGKPGWWGLAPLLAAIPFVGWIPALIIWIMVSIAIAKNFGKSEVFGVVGLWLFSTIGYLILGFGSATYQPVGQMASEAGGPKAPTPPMADGPTAPAAS